MFTKKANSPKRGMGDWSFFLLFYPLFKNYDHHGHQSYCYFHEVSHL